MDINKEKRKAKDDIKKKFKTFLCFFLVDMITTLGGSCLFLYIEHCYDVRPQTKTSIETNYEALCHQLKSGNLTTAEYLTNKTSVVIQNLCVDAPIKVSELECKFDTKNIFKWTRFCMSVGFTTGYGRIVPYSDVGKIVTIFYALLLIPLTAATLVHCSTFCVGMLKLAILVIEERVLRRKEIFHFNGKTMVFQTLLLLVVLHAFVFSSRSQIVDSNNNPTSSLIDAYYFTIISMTTVGFGDYGYTQEFYDALEESPEKATLNNVYSLLYLLLMAMGASFINAMTSFQTSQPPCKKKKQIPTAPTKSVENPVFNKNDEQE